MPSKKKPTVTSSTNRAYRAKAAASAARKKTTSSGKGAGPNPKVDSRKTRQSRPTAKVTRSQPKKVTGTSSAKVTSSASRDAGPSKADAQQWKKYNQSAKTSGTGWKGAPGTKDAPKNAQPTGPRNPQAQIAANRMKRALTLAKQGREAAATARKVAQAGKGGAILGAAAAGLTARNTADGTLKGKPTGPVQGPKVPERLKKASSSKPNPYKAGSFDHAFKAARNAGRKTFTWKGKKYTTETK